MNKTENTSTSGENSLSIYHNPRCQKSREGLAILENSGKEFTIIKYLENPLSEEKLFEIIKLLKVSPIGLIRQNEKIWKENFKGKNLSEEKIIKAMVENPKLIERPIVVNHTKAIIGRPPELIKTIL